MVQEGSKGLQLAQALRIEAVRIRSKDPCSGKSKTVDGVRYPCKGEKETKGPAGIQEKGRRKRSPATVEANERSRYIPSPHSGAEIPGQRKECRLESSTSRSLQVLFQEYFRDRSSLLSAEALLSGRWVCFRLCARRRSLYT